MLLGFNTSFDSHLELYELLLMPFKRHTAANLENRILINMSTITEVSSAVQLHLRSEDVFRLEQKNKSTVTRQFSGLSFVYFGA